MLAVESPETRVDPIATLVAHARIDAGAKPAALVDLEIEITISGGLALVEARRMFRNSEGVPIEALLSLPVPVHAAFFGLSARVGERVLNALAQPRSQARDRYEEAIDSGKAAVLHEELLRGVHAVSVGNLGAGESVEVTTRWAEVLRCTGGHGRLRVPLTVGDVYGISGLADVDELAHGGPKPFTTLKIRHDAESVRLAHGELLPTREGFLTAAVPADAPIDVEVEGWMPGTLRGRAADGREVTLRIEPCPEAEGDLDAALLVDRSASMLDDCEGSGAALPLTKHEAVKRSLRGLASGLDSANKLSLWEFSYDCTSVGDGNQTSPKFFEKLVEDLQPPSGGTEIGNAIKTVINATEGCDIILITDGMSYGLDVQHCAMTGRRISVVLVGEDSLEARVGHLAALTGGDIHFSFGADVDEAMRSTLQGLRATRNRANLPEFSADGLPERILATRANASIEARWSGNVIDGEQDTFSTGVAAFATGLAIGVMEESAAERLAVDEGLVTHLTSLVLVDDEGGSQVGLPVTRKLLLPSPRTTQGAKYCMAQAVDVRDWPGAADTLVDERGSGPKHPLPQSENQLERIGLAVNWDENANALIEGNLESEDAWVAASLRSIASDDQLRALAPVIGVEPIQVAVAVVAHAVAKHSRTAGRVKRRLLRSANRKLFDLFARAFSPNVGTVQ